MATARCRRGARISSRDRCELLVRDLSERGLESLSVRLNPHREDERAVRHELRGAAFVARNERTAAADPFATAVAGLFRIAGKAHADQPAIGLALSLPRAHRGKVDGVGAKLDRGGIVAVVEFEI